MATTIQQYWTEQIPARPIAIDVYDSYGRSINLSTYENFDVKVVGSDNEDIDLTGSVLSTAGASSGRFVFRWPTDRSVFTKPGEYLLQLEFSGAGSRDFTSTHTIKVRRLGGNN